MSIAGACPNTKSHSSSRPRVVNNGSGCGVSEKGTLQRACVQLATEIPGCRFVSGVSFWTSEPQTPIQFRSTYKSKEISCFYVHSRSSTRHLKATLQYGEAICFVRLLGPLGIPPFCGMSLVQSIVHDSLPVIASHAWRARL